MIYDIHRCTISEKDAIQEFLKKHWSENHIFTYCDQILDFQQKSTDGHYNFFCATNTTTGQIDALMGYIPIAHFDSSLQVESQNIWGAIWKVRTDVQNSEIGLLGLLLLNRLTKGQSTYGAIGISPIAEQIYQIKGWKTGQMNQYYILNPEIECYHIAKIENQILKIDKKKSNVELRCIDWSVLATQKYAYTPKKSGTYFVNRYKKHPIYTYLPVGVMEDGVLRGVLVIRKVTIGASCCLRIVDIMGDVERMNNIYYAALNLLNEFNAEYIDCYNYGIPEVAFGRLGFSLLDASQEQIIIPNYFEPFLQKNITIRLGYKAPENYAYVAFKGDSDQDRPNTIE